MPASIRNLPKDVLMDILSRLPVKDVTRCKCVCKSWQSLFADPYFIKLHLDRSLLIRKPPHLVITLNPFSTLDCAFLDNDEPPELASLTLEDTGDIPSFEILGGSCNGLICLASEPTSLLLSLFNPCTREHIPLPLDSSFDKGLISDTEFPNNSIVQGFGYSQALDEYKVLRILCKDNNKTSTEFLRVDVYTTGTNSWTRLDNCAPSFPVYIKPWFPITHLNGILHCLMRTPRSGTPDSILSFDLTSYKFGVVSLPPYFQKIREEEPDLELMIRFYVFEECLAMLLCARSRSDYTKPPSYDLWMMKAYGVSESWVKILSIDGMSVGWKRMSHLCPFKPLFRLKSGQIVLEKTFAGLVLYDPVANTFTDVMLPWNRTLPISIGLKGSYVESLTSISLPQGEGSRLYR